MNIYLIFFLLFSFFSSTIYPQIEHPLSGEPPVQILFVGNSLTYTNDLPKLVTKEAKSKGINVKTVMIAYPNYSLQDHWDQNTFQNLLELSEFDYLVIQQGPSSQTEGKETLLKYGRMFKNLCEKNKTRLAYFMVWPSLQYYESFHEVIENHENASIKNQAILCPVGEIWKNYITTHQKFDLYSADGFHPSRKGSQIAAEVIVASLFNL